MVMNDFELHKLCSHYKGLDKYELSDDHILDSGKFECMNQLLKEIERAVWIFSVFRFDLRILSLIRIFCLAN